MYLINIHIFQAGEAGSASKAMVLLLLSSNITINIDLLANSILTNNMEYVYINISEQKQTHIISTNLKIWLHKNSAFIYFKREQLPIH